MTIRDLLEKYTDDHDLIDTLDFLLSHFSIIENPAEFVSFPMEYYVNLPCVTIEMCQLIYKIQQEEKKNNSEWASDPKREEVINQMELYGMMCNNFTKKYIEDLEKCTQENLENTYQPS